MSRPQALSPDEVAAAVAELTHWDGDPQGIYRRVDLPTFRAAIDAVVAIADIDVRYSSLRVSVATHDAGGVTVLDVELARRVDALFPADPAA